MTDQEIIDQCSIFAKATKGQRAAMISKVDQEIARLQKEITETQKLEALCDHLAVKFNVKVTA